MWICLWALCVVCIPTLRLQGFLHVSLYGVGTAEPSHEQCASSHNSWQRVGTRDAMMFEFASVHALHCDVPFFASSLWLQIQTHAQKLSCMYIRAPGGYICRIVCGLSCRRMMLLGTNMSCSCNHVSAHPGGYMQFEWFVACLAEE